MVDIFSSEEMRIVIFFCRWMLLLICCSYAPNVKVDLFLYLLLPFLISHCSVISMLTWFLAEME